MMVLMLVGKDDDGVVGVQVEEVIGRLGLACYWLQVAARWRQMQRTI
jgi:hypothetical protein